MVLAIVIVLARRPPEVELAAVRDEPVRRVLAMTGEIAPRERVDVIAEVPGTVVELLKDEGDRVRAGEPIARLDATTVEAALTQARAGLAARRRQVAERRRDLARREKLLARGVLPEAEVDAQRAEVAAGEADLARLAAVVEEAEARLAKYRILSPLTGIVVDRPIDPGQTVDTRTVIFELATQGAPRVESEVDEMYLRELREGMPATIGLPGDVSRTWSAKVTWVSPKVDVQTGGGIVRVGFEGKPPDLPIGLSVDVNVLVERRDRALTVPRTAVLDPRTAPRVFVVEGDRVQVRPIEVVDWPAERIVVTAGLDERAAVVADPSGVRPGARVRTR